MAGVTANRLAASVLASEDAVGDCGVTAEALLTAEFREGDPAGISGRARWTAEARLAGLIPAGVRGRDRGVPATWLFLP